MINYVHTQDLLGLGGGFQWLINLFCGFSSSFQERGIGYNQWIDETTYRWLYKVSSQFIQEVENVIWFDEFL